MDEAEVIGRLVSWGSGEDAVRAMIITSSRAAPGARVDSFSDFDLIVAVNDPPEFLQDDAWSSAYGRPLVRWGDEAELYGLTTFFRGVIYEDYVKIDYTFWPDTLLNLVSDGRSLPASLDVGYRVLLDKDAATTGWGRPTFSAYIPTMPTEDEYRALIEEFWWDTTYFAKSVWRNDILFARSYVLEYDMKAVALRRLFEWRIEIDNAWSIQPGVYGRGLERFLPPDISADLMETSVGPGTERSWDALFRTTALFRRVALEVGTALGYAYPTHVDDRITAHLNAVRRRLPAGDA